MDTHNIIIERLAGVAGNIAIKTIWTPDPYFSWDGDGPDPRDEGLSPHDVTVHASAIINGVEHIGAAHMGGCYAREGEYCPEINGYFPQMLIEALEDLPKEIPNRDSAINAVRN